MASRGHPRYDYAPAPPRGATSAREPEGGRMSHGDGPSFLTMIGFVAVLVAAVILVFFGIGYLIGRVFL